MHYPQKMLTVALAFLALNATADSEIHAGPFELSGCAVVEGGLLLADDELVGSVLFLPSQALVDPSLQARASLVKLQRKRKKSKPFTKLDRLIPVQDFEGIASDRKRTVFLLGSHASKDGKRRTDREFLLRAALDPEENELESPIVVQNLLDQLKTAARDIGLDLALSKTEVHPDLNLEALAYDGTNLLIGFRAPLLGNTHAIIAIVEERALFENGRPRIQIRTVDLGGLGIRGMEHLAGDTFLLLAGPKNDTAPGESMLVEYNIKTSQSTVRHRFGGLSVQAPEGVAKLDDDSIAVAFDATGTIVRIDPQR